MPMAVVTDLGSRVTYWAWSSSKASASSSTSAMLATAPDRTPARMAFQFRRSCWSWR